MMNSFVPLRVHSEFSIEDGTVRLDDAVRFAVEQQFPAMALTDAMNMFAAIKFYKSCRNHGIVPILGVDAEMKSRSPEGPSSRLLFLAKNHQGYQTLCEWLTKAHIDEQREIRPQLDWSWLENDDRTGLICLSGGKDGAIGQAILNEQYRQAENIAQYLADLFPNAFYLEIQRLPEHDRNAFSESLNQRFDALRQHHETALSGSLNIAEKLDLPVVATHPVQFMQADDFIAHEVRVCIGAGELLADDKRERKFHPSQFFLSGQRMQELFSDLPEAIENTVEIAKRCSTEIVLGKHFLPQFPTPNNLSLGEYLQQEARAGLLQRMKVLYPDEAERMQKLPEYQQRLEFELDIIIQMDFPGYFLIVADFINWAKNNNCPVGPGRGSGAGSLVAYALKITDLDPLRYALLFERFLNPERVSMPDFDVDFCQENRYRVIDYVRHQYGEDAVSQIITFSTLSSKAVVRDVGRVLEFPFAVCDKLSKLIPVEKNKPMHLAQALESEPEIKKFLDQENAHEIMSLSMKLEDLTRGTGMHAGGVLIAKGKLTDYCPVYRAANDDAVTVSMYDKDDVEQAGLVKFDFLGLRNLTIIRMAEEMIQQLRQEEIHIEEIPLDDASVYRDIFAKGNTTAVFQFESTGMKRMLKEAGTTQFEELIAFVSLYRPGPMDLIPDFIARMRGKPFEYLHPVLESVLRPTYGVMVYQEQVMQAAQVCAGYSLGGADMLRRAMGKKKAEEMIKHRQIFVDGAAQKGIDEAKANEIFDYMEKFAGYGFNKSHAAAYALVSYQTAWLKKHYTAEFFAATMSSEMANTDQLKIFHDDARENGIQFLPPLVNESNYRFTPLSPTQIRYALGAIKGTGENVINLICEARQAGGKFKDLFDFCQRVDKQQVNRRVLEALICAGAFDDINSNRAQLLANIDLAMDYAEQKAASQMQCGLFDAVSDAIEAVQLKEEKPWKLTEKLIQEKMVMGFYFSAHPFEPYAKEIRAIASTPLRHLQPLGFKKTAWIGGFVTSVRFIYTKDNSKLYIVVLEDNTGKQEVMVPETTIQEYGEDLKPDTALLFNCQITEDRKDNTQVRILAKQIRGLNQVRMSRIRYVEIILHHEDPIEQIAQIIQTAPKGERTVPISIEYISNQVSGSLKSDITVTPSQELLEEIGNLIGHQHIELKF